MNDYLRKECKLLKALQNISYNEIAEYMEMSNSSFYNWLCQNYDFGEEKQLRLREIVSNLKKANGIIPGIRPGKPTADYIEAQTKYLTLIGAICIWLITEIPMFISHFTNIYSFSFGGTSLVIVVSVVVETAKAIATERQTRVYEKVSFLGIKPDNKSTLKGVLG